jgi:excisionase family DNA binding protein
MRGAPDNLRAAAGNPRGVVRTFTARDRLALVLAPELVDVLEELITERVAAALATIAPAESREARWLTVEQAAERLGCSPDAVRMRVRRGRLEHRRQGRRLYVAADSVDRLG